MPASLWLLKAKDDGSEAAAGGELLELQFPQNEPSA